MIRNFAIIAHIDSGKTTLTDRLLQATHAVAARDFHDRLLDANPIEQERGVTIKLAPVTMNYELHATRYLLNLIDTPGHVDFSYEVDRSLAACEGAILLIDGTRGIQAQTLSSAHKAVNLGLHLIPAINKIDLPSANIDQCLRQLDDVFGFRPEEVSRVSAKTGQGVDDLLARVITDIPAPQGNPAAPLRALVFNSTYDDHLGVIAFVRVFAGCLKPTESQKVGIFTPSRRPVDQLTTGQVGYLATGLKDIRGLHLGATPAYHPPQPVVFVDTYPADATAYENLVAAVAKLRLSDASLTARPIHSTTLGSGLRLGCLGLFHIDITRERLAREYQVSTLITTPTVEYLILLTNGQTLTVTSPKDLPDPASIRSISEPWVKITLITPPACIGSLMQILEHRRGIYATTGYFGNQAQLVYRLPLAELITGLIDQVKSVSQGYASFDYASIPSQPVDLVKLDILVHHQPVDSLSRLVVTDQALRLGRHLVAKLKEIMPPSQFAVPIQAVINGQVIARETKSALRKDVTAKLYGGDQTRKDKLLTKQKKGKQLLAQTGHVYLSSRVLTQLATTT